MLSPPSPIRSGIRLVGLALLLAAGGPDVRAQDAPVVRLTCGAYEAVPSGVGQAGKPTRVSIQKNGRLLQTVSDWSITRVDCSDFNNDRTLELLVTSESGGAHCCETLRIWSLGASPRQLLEYQSGNAAGFELRDLDGDGHMELILVDDSFAYFDDLCDTCSPGHLPLVACSTGRAFEECTRRFPGVSRTWMTRYVDRLTAPGADVTHIEGAALGVLAISVLLGEEAAALALIRKAVPDDDVIKWVERARPKVRDWADTRGKKLKDRRH